MTRGRIGERNWKKRIDSWTDTLAGKLEVLGLGFGRDEDDEEEWW